MQVHPISTFPRFPGNENPYLAWTTFSRAIIDTFSRAPVISQHEKCLLGPLLTPAKYASLPGVPEGDFVQIEGMKSAVYCLRFVIRLCAWCWTASWCHARACVNTPSLHAVDNDLILLSLATDDASSSSSCLAHQIRCLTDDIPLLLKPLMRTVLATVPWGVLVALCALVRAKAW